MAASSNTQAWFTHPSSSLSLSESIVLSGVELVLSCIIMYLGKLQSLGDKLVLSSLFFLQAKRPKRSGASSSKWLTGISAIWKNPRVR
jgi:hypothetical protein